MCDCFALAMPPRSVSAPDRSGTGGTAPGAVRSGSRPGSAPRSRRSPAARRDAPWADVHAHPGRFFLRGLARDEPATTPLAADATERALGDLAAGGVDLVSYSTVSDLRVLRFDPVRGIRAGRAFEPGEAVRDHARQMAALDDILTRDGVEPILGPGDLAVAQAGGRVGILRACEGGDFLAERLERVEEAYERGVRSITLVHYRVNELGDIQTEPPAHGGLTAFGASVVREMNRLGMVVDLAHATFEVTKQVLDVSSHPVVISHSHLARGDAPHPRLLSREHALAVTKGGGLVGAWPAGVALGSFDDFIDEILRMVDALGVAHVAIGTDMDANDRPVLQSYREFPDLETALTARGLARDEVASILGGNFLRLFETVTS